MAALSLLRSQIFDSALTPLFLLYLTSKSIRKSHHFNLQNMSRVQSLFTIFTSTTLVQATFTFYLDYCNSFLIYHLLPPVPFLSTLAILLEHPLDHVTPLLRNLIGFCHTQVCCPEIDTEMEFGVQGVN